MKCDSYLFSNLQARDEICDTGKYSPDGMQEATFPFYLEDYRGVRSSLKNTRAA